MTINEYKKHINVYVDCYLEGRYTVSECIQVIDKFIQNNTWLIPDINQKISKQNKLYKYALKALHDSIVKMDRI